jgi:uncharacterized integral membrane protein (TIGR00697 family)
VTASAPAPARGYRYYDLVVGAFVAVLLCSNLIGPGKTVAFTMPLLGTTVRFGAGNLFFPISYIFDDVLTEVYGYARARRAIWAGFAGMLLATLMATVVIGLKPDPTSAYNRLLQPALEIVFGNTWRIALASLAAFWVGDFVNSYVLARMKVLTRGRYLWTRTIGSTVVGELADSLIFYPIAFAGLWSSDTLVSAVAFNWAFKVALEAALTPLTYVVVALFKRVESEDYYDVGTNFTPFSLKG